MLYLGGHTKKATEICEEALRRPEDLDHPKSSKTLEKLNGNSCKRTVIS